MKLFKYEIKYNNQSVGKLFYSRRQAKKHWNELWSRELYGYTISKL